MRITNKIMHNNSVYNINANKVAQDDINTQVATGKKLTRPSDDPVVAIRALRLRSNVTELTQYYDKNAKDAKSWLSVTEDALSTVTDVLTSLIQQANKGVNQYQDLDDVKTILTQMEALSDEYYSTGNEDYAGRYIFTGYRTNESLTFKDDETSQYEEINDLSNASDVDTSHRIIGAYALAASDEVYNKESSIEDVEVGRVRLSYDQLDSETENVTLRYRTPMIVSATTTLSTSSTMDTIALSYKDSSGVTHKANISTGSTIGEEGNTVTVTEADSSTTTYTASVDDDGNYTITANNSVNGTTTMTLNSNGVITSQSGESVTDVAASVSDASLSTFSFTTSDGTTSIEVPLTGASSSPYTVAVTSDGGNAYTITVNTDGTYKITNEPLDLDSVSDGDVYNVVNLSSNGSVYSSYEETVLKPSSYGDVDVIDATTSEEDIDAIYKELSEEESEEKFYINAKNGEVIVSEALKKKLTSLSNLTNASTINVTYDKSSWETGDIRPETLMKCTNVDDGATIVYNGGCSGHIMEYDVGYGQTIEVNTTADEVFTTDVKRDVEDLREIVDQMSDLDAMLSTMKSNLADETDEDKKVEIQNEIDATQKAYDYLKEDLKTMFGEKITSLQDSLNVANVAVTENGTRSSRLSMTMTRLQTQLTTFKTLQSENEDVDLAEAATNLATAELTYQASLMATSKILQESLMNYI